MATDVRKGYFSLVRYRKDPFRDEAKNIAILLVDAEGEFAGIRTAPQSKFRRGLKRKTPLREMLEDLENRFSAEEGLPDIGFLREMHESLDRSLVVTEPRPVAVTDLDRTVSALYKAYVQPRTGGSNRRITRGSILNQAVESLTARGFKVEKNTHIQGFPVGLVIANGKPEHPHIAEALSFASESTYEPKWIEEERVAGSFIFAVRKMQLPHFAIVQPPTEISLERAYVAHERVVEWFTGEGVRTVEPSELENGELPLEP